MGAVCESDMHENHVYRSDSYGGMHTISRHRYNSGASSGAPSRNGAGSAHCMRSSDSMDIMHDVVMAHVPVRGPSIDINNLLDSSDAPLSEEEVAEWGRQTSGLSDVFTMPAGAPVVATSGHRYPSGDVISTPCTLSRAPSSTSIASSVQQHHLLDVACMTRMHEADAAHTRLLARVTSDACTQDAAQRNPSASSREVCTGAAVAEGCTSALGVEIREGNSLGVRGEVQGDLHASEASQAVAGADRDRCRSRVEQVAPPGWRCRSSSRSRGVWSPPVFPVIP